MKINQNSQYDTFRISIPKSQASETKEAEVLKQKQKEMAQMPFSQIKPLNMQVAQVQELQKGIEETKQKHEELLLSLQGEKTPKTAQKIRNIELKIAEILKKSLTQSQKLEALPSLYRNLLHAYSQKDYAKFEDLLTQTQGKLHHLLEKFEDEIAQSFPQDLSDFDKSKLTKNLFSNAHHPSKLSAQCLA